MSQCKLGTTARISRCLYPRNEAYRSTGMTRTRRLYMGFDPRYYPSTQNIGLSTSRVSKTMSYPTIRANGAVGRLSRGGVMHPCQRQHCDTQHRRGNEGEEAKSDSCIVDGGRRVPVDPGTRVPLGCRLGEPQKAVIRIFTMRLAGTTIRCHDIANVFRVERFLQKRITSREATCDRYGWELGISRLSPPLPRISVQHP